MKSADGRFRYLGLDHKPVGDGSKPEDVHRFAFRCRMDPTEWCDVNLRGRGHDVERRSWAWDGNVDRPTLSPSINCQNDTCWHGFIENGVFVNTAKQPEPKQ